MKRVIAFILTIVMVLSISSVAFSKDATGNNNIRVSLNGETVTFKTANPYVENGYLMVSARDFAEKMGYLVTWDAPKITLVNVSNIIVFEANSKRANFNSMEKQSPIKASIKNGIAYVPLRFLCENIGESVSYNATSASIDIKKNVAAESSPTASPTTSPAVSQEPSQKNDSQGLDFSERLNQQMPTNQNYMFSPLSIKMALAMAANGADGATQKEILDVTGIKNLDTYNQTAKKLMQNYNGEKNGVILNLANSVWLNTDYYKGSTVDFSDTYKSLIQNNYDGEVQKVNNSNAVNTINNWVSQKTNQKINSIIIDNNFLATLVNATYFKGQWNEPFLSENTKKDTFTDRNKKTSSIDFMNKTGYYYYSDSDWIPIISLPYKGHISMYIALSDNRKIDFEKAIAKMTVRRVAIHLPKFHTEYSTMLKATLKNMGINTVFDSDKADFKSMFTKTPDNIFISEVIHKTYIDVNEEGTEAAAVTALIAPGGCAATTEEPIAFNADKPFTYFIRDDESGEILFMGEYAFAK